MRKNAFDLSNNEEEDNFERIKKEFEVKRWLEKSDSELLKVAETSSTERRLSLKTI